MQSSIILSCVQSIINPVIPTQVGIYDSVLCWLQLSISITRNYKEFIIKFNKKFKKRESRVLV